jgi:ATP-dependent DNA ligase
MKTQVFKSSSTPGVQYTAVLTEDRATCTCPGWINNRKCWHIDELRGIPRGGGKAKKVTAPQNVPLPLESIRPIPILSMQASPLPEGVDIDQFMGPGWVMEEKYDGHRRIIEVTEAREVYFWSRQGNLQTVPRHMLDSLRCLAPAIYDGEEIIPGGTSTDVKAGVNSGRSELYLFDILRVGASQDTTKLTLRERRALLEVASVNCEHIGPVRLSQQMEVSRTTLKAIWAQGREGTMVKKWDSRYQPGKRSTEWVKFKKFENTPVTLTGFEAGLLGPHSRLVAVDEFGVEVRCKTLNDEWRAIFATRAQEFMGRKFNIEHQGRLKTGKYRSPMFDHFID